MRKIAKIHRKHPLNRHKYETMNRFDTFGTAKNCLDGRVQIPVLDWIKLHSRVQYVDMITEPGVDKVLAQGKQDHKFQLMPINQRSLH